MSSPRRAPGPPARAAPSPTAPTTAPAASAARPAPPLGRGRALPPTSPRTAVAPAKGQKSPRSRFPAKPPPRPPTAPPTNLAVPVGRLSRLSGEPRARHRMPTIRVARPVVRAAVSFDAPTAAVAASPPTEPSIDTLLEDATLKVCVECIEEGYDNFCAKCGGRMVPLGDDEPDVAESMDELESLSLSAQDLLVCNEGLARLEALLKPDEPPPQPQPSPRVEEVRKPSKPVPVTPVTHVPPSVSVPATSPPAATHPTPVLTVKSPVVASVFVPAASAGPSSSASVPFKPVAKPARVFIIDFGSDVVKYGYSTDAKPSCVRACVDARATTTTAGMRTVKGQVFPLDAIGHNEDTFSDRNIYLDDLARKICKIGGYAAATTPLVVTTSVPSHTESVCEWAYRWGQGEVTGEQPAALYLGYSPLLALYAAAASPCPTGLVVEVSASGACVVPVYMGCKIDHAIQSQALGGRMLADIVGACSGLRDDALTDSMRTHCYVALDFKEEMRSHGFAPAAPAAGQAFRGWKGPAVAPGSGALGIERFAGPELLFHPSFHAQSDQMAPLPQLVRLAVQLVPKQLHSSLLSRIYLTGAVAHMRGLEARLRAEVAALFPHATANIVVCPLEAAAWAGCKHLSAEAVFPQLCTSPADMQRYTTLAHRFF